MYNAFLLNDFYKITHLLQYSDKITHLTSYLTPRGSRLKHEGINEVVFFGLAGYVKKYVMENFNNNFFKKNFSIIKDEVKEVLELGLGYSDDLISTTCNKLQALHELGYLPVEINGVPEGILVPMGVPCVEIRSTNPEFFWVGQSLEASLSAAIWHPMVSATIAREYRKIAKTAFERTVEDGVDERTAMCDFSMRGQESNESAIASSAAWLTSMWNSSTVMARSYIQDVYFCHPEAITIGGLTSTEHSVMTSHACLDNGDEIPTFRYLFDLYKDTSFAAVCDSYDFWNVLTNILPLFKDIIDERGKRGKFIGVRHDSADPVEALCGTIPYFDCDDKNALGTICTRENSCPRWRAQYVFKKLYTEYQCPQAPTYICLKMDGEFKYFIKNTYEPDEFTISWRYIPIDLKKIPYEYKGMVETMWELFGGTVNSKGFKVLNPGIKAVYGDSITVTRAKEIYRRLEEKGFAANNVSLGVGSFSFQCLEGSDYKLNPFTRDTFAIACKCTYSKYLDENGNEQERFVYKDPKGYQQKKSQRGLCVTWIAPDGTIGYTDELNEAERENYSNNIMVRYFKDGWATAQSFYDIRDIITNNL